MRSEAPTRCNWHSIVANLRRLAHPLVFALVFGSTFPALASDPGTRQEAEGNKPAVLLDLSKWGYTGLSPLGRFGLKANVTVNFVDKDHVLFTFNPKKLVTRRPECPPTHVDHIVHAVVIDIHSHAAVQETDWYLHDERRYLWSLGRGRFLLRRLNSLYEVDADLKERFLLNSPHDLLWMNVTADRKQIILETAAGPQPADVHSSQRKPGQARVKIEFLDVESLAMTSEVQATGLVELEAISSGYADATRNLSGKTWLVRFGTNASERKYLARVKSPCQPDLLFPTDRTLFIGRCSPSSGSDYSASVFTISGHPLWRDRWSQSRRVPVLEQNEDGSRFAISSFAGISESNTSAEAAEDDPKWPAIEQIVRVFETASGHPVFLARTREAILENQNFSLAPDGSHLVLLDGSILAIYELPPMSVEERSKYVAMKADAPGLFAAVAPTSAEDDEEATPMLASARADADGDLREADPGAVASNKAGDLSGAPTKPPTSSGETGATTDQSVSVPASTFKSRAEEVVVDVVATDSKGHPVKNLPQQDFQIEEDGKPQKVAYFHEFTGTAPPAPAPAVPAPANTFTNNVVARSDQPVVVIVLDFVNTPFTDQQYAKRQLLKFLKNKPKHSQFSLCVLTDRLQLLSGFTSDENLLAANISSKKGRIRFSSELEQNVGLGDTIAAEKQAAEADFHAQYTVQQLQQLRVEDRAWQLDRRMSLTTDAFVQLARYLSGIPGRKNLVWLSASFPSGFFSSTSLNRDNVNIALEAHTYADQIRRATNLLAEAHVAVYPVDVRGLSVGTVFGATTNTDPIGPAAPGSNMQGPPGRTPAPPLAGVNTAMNIAAPTPQQAESNEERDNRAAEQDTMEQIATETGGKAFYSSNGVQQAIETAVEQSTQYYMLSYSPANRKYDGNFRKIKVTYAKKEFRLVYRRGYYALDTETPIKDSTELSREIGTGAMQHGAPQSHQLSFAVHVLPIGKRVKVPTPQAGVASSTKKSPPSMVEAQRYSIDYAVAGPQVHFTTMGEVHHAVLDFALSAFDDNGNVLTHTATQITSDLRPAIYRDAMIGGLRMHQEADVPVSATSLRLGVEDELGRHLGTIELPLPLKTPQGGPHPHTHSLPQLEPE